MAASNALESNLLNDALTAMPSGDGQAKRVMARSSWNQESVSMLNAHSAGSSVHVPDFAGQEQTGAGGSLEGEKLAETLMAKLHALADMALTGQTPAPEA